MISVGSAPFLGGGLDSGRLWSVSIGLGYSLIPSARPFHRPFCFSDIFRFITRRGHMFE